MTVVNEVKKKLEVMSKMADLIEGLEPDEAIRMFFSTLMLLGYDPNSINAKAKEMKGNLPKSH
jgi:hypothetical protein